MSFANRIVSRSGIKWFLVNSRALIIHVPTHREIRKLELQALLSCFPTRFHYDINIAPAHSVVGNNVDLGQGKGVGPDNVAYFNW